MRCEGSCCYEATPAAEEEHGALCDLIRLTDSTKRYLALSLRFSGLPCLSLR